MATEEIDLAATALQRLADEDMRSDELRAPSYHGAAYRRLRLRRLFATVVAQSSASREAAESPVLQVVALACRYIELAHPITVAPV